MFRSTVHSACFFHIPPAEVSGTTFHCFHFCPCLKLVSTSYGQTTPHMTADHGVCTASSHLAEAVVCNMVAGWLFVWKSLSTRDTEIVLKGRLVPETLGCLCCKTSGQCSSVDRCDPWPKEQCQQQLPVQGQHLYQSHGLKVEWYWDTRIISLYFVPSDE